METALGRPTTTANYEAVTPPLKREPVYIGAKWVYTHKTDRDGLI